MISDLLRQVGHIIVLMVGDTSSWPCTSISASDWPTKQPARCSTRCMCEAITPDQPTVLRCIAEAAVAAERETGCPAEISASQCIVESDGLMIAPGNKRDEETLLYAMGSEAANVHLGSKRQIADILKDLGRRKSNWLRSAARDMAKAMEGDWKRYKDS